MNRIGWKQTPIIELLFGRDMNVVDITDNIRYEKYKVNGTEKRQYYA